MKKIKVIKNVPTRLPVSSFILYIFLMEIYNVSDFWKGVAYVLMFIIFSICVYAIFHEEKIDMFSENKDFDYEPKKSMSFEERIKEVRDSSDKKQ